MSTIGTTGYTIVSISTHLLKSVYLRYRNILTDLSNLHQMATPIAITTSTRTVMMQT